ncbi:unnamed protein product [Arctogadus glacialis]
MLDILFEPITSFVVSDDPTPHPTPIGGRTTCPPVLGSHIGQKRLVFGAGLSAGRPAVDITEWGGLLFTYLASLVPPVYSTGSSQTPSPSPHGDLDVLVPTVALRDTLTDSTIRIPRTKPMDDIGRSVVTSSSLPTDTLTSLTHCHHERHTVSTQTDRHTRTQRHTHTHTQDGDTGLIYLSGHPGSSWVRAFTLLPAG